MRKIASFISCVLLMLALCSCSSQGAVAPEATEEPVETRLKYVEDVEMTLAFSFGERTGIYSGTINADGAPDGFGSFSSENTEGFSWTYSGQWINGHWNGAAISTWDDHSQYGIYSDDSLEEIGITKMYGAETIVQTMHDGVAEGYEIIYFQNGDVFLFQVAEQRPVTGVYGFASGDFVLAVMDDNGDIYPLEDAEVDSDENEEGSQPPETDLVEADAEIEEETADDIEEKEAAPTVNHTAGEVNALRSAKNYLSIMPFSYSGLIGQLEFEGYSNSEATYAADNCGADWYAQAEKAAANYLDIMSFSRSGLIGQLEFDGYTHDQAVYGVEQNGL